MLKREERKHIWNRIGFLLRTNDRLEKQVQEAPFYWDTCPAAERYQSETTKGNIELFDLLDRLLVDSGLKGKRQ